MVPLYFNSLFVNVIIGDVFNGYASEYTLIRKIV